MLLVMQAPAELLVCSVGLVRRHWSPLVLVLLAPRLMIQVLVHYLMGGFPRRIRGY
jgi:hypothetical protein